MVMIAAAWSGYLSLPPRLYCPLHKRCNPALTRLDPTAAVQVKRYDGNVEDLGLTFCVDDDFFGSKVHHNLLPGGSDIPVTNDNRCVRCRLRRGFMRSVSSSVTTGERVAERSEACSLQR